MTSTDIAHCSNKTIQRYIHIDGYTHTHTYRQMYAQNFFCGKKNFFYLFNSIRDKYHIRINPIAFIFAKSTHQPPNMEIKSTWWNCRFRQTAAPICIFQGKNLSKKLFHLSLVNEMRMCYTHIKYIHLHPQNLHAKLFFSRQNVVGCDF